MVIKRIYNNNVAMVDDEGVERIAIGRGITFGHQRGDELAMDVIEKIFTLDSSDSLNRLEHLIKNIPSEYLSVAEDIVTMLRAELGDAIDDNVLIALTDHISMAIERERAEVLCENPLLMETRRFYKKEFALAQRAQDIIEDALGIRVSEGEVGFITLHIVNASMKQRADHLMLSISMINEILSIVAEEFNLTYDEESIQYERFLRHLQFFAQRMLDKDVVQSEDTFLFHLGKDQYPAAFECTERIGEHVARTYGCAVTDAEKGYLVYHIMNLVNAACADAPAVSPGAPTSPGSEERS